MSEPRNNFDFERIAQEESALRADNISELRVIIWKRVNAFQFDRHQSAIATISHLDDVLES